MLYPKNKSSRLSKELFEKPTAEYRGAPFWAWNNKLDREELLRQVDVLDEMGMGGFHIQDVYKRQASRLALEGKIEAVVTLPVNKEAIRLSDKNFTGHTELIAGICGQTDYTMMLASKKLTVTHVSTHVSMEQAIENVKKDRVLKVIKLTFEALHKWIEEPRIAVAGLNAHAGEGGAFGMEDGREIVPAVEEAKASGMNVTGPLPPDTVFLRAYKMCIRDRPLCQIAPYKRHPVLNMTVAQLRQLL